MARRPANTARAQIAYTGGNGYELPPGATIAWRPVYCAGFDAICKVCAERDRAAGQNVKRYRAQHYLDYVGFHCPVCGGNDFDRHFHHFENIPCGCEPGPQMKTLLLGDRVDELAHGGGRGSAKSECGFALSIRGNPGVPNPTGVDVSYINHPKYRFLVLRKNSKDLEDCFRRAREFYASFGGVPTESPSMRIKFPSGAEGIFDHMQDESAYEKYQGQEFQFIWAEEITQIP